MKDVWDTAGTSKTVDRSCLNAIIDWQVNAVGALAIAVLSSLTTVVMFKASSEWNWVDVEPVARTSTAAPAGTIVSLECGALIYSPVQRRCVDRVTFDGEMKRLMEALGLDANSIRSNHD